MIHSKLTPLLTLIQGQLNHLFFSKKSSCLASKLAVSDLNIQDGQVAHLVQVLSRIFGRKMTSSLTGNDSTCFPRSLAHSPRFRIQTHCGLEPTKSKPSWEYSPTVEKARWDSESDIMTW